MKSTRWLILLLVMGIAVLLVVRHQKKGAETSTAASSETSTEATAPTPAPAAVNEVLPLTSVAALTDSPTPKPLDPLEGANHLQVIVLNESNQPLEGASVRTSIRGEPRQPSLTNLSRTFTTTPQGIADVLWPTQELVRLQLVISKDEYSPRSMIWDFKTGDQVPPTYTVKLKASIHLGGIVVDPEGNPVAEATVTANRFWRGGEIRDQGEEATFPTQKHTTGADGRWTARNVPLELLERITITGSHSNFIDTRVMLDGKDEIQKELRAGTYKLELTRGLIARGRVINSQQQPIADAEVWAGRRFFADRKQTKTDALGQFTFQNIKTGAVDFSAMAEGYAPNYKAQEVATSGEVVLQLEKGSIIRGLVQDESQQPIEDVRVSVDGSPPDASYDRFEFSTTTDAEGKFEWRSAPTTPISFYFGKLGYQQKRNVRMKSGEDNVVTLRPNRTVQGQVLDADTEKPVTRFTAAIGTSHGINQFYANSQSTKEFKSEQGLFTVELHEETENAVQVTATGYAEQTKTLPAAENGEIKVVFKLKPSATLTGIVVTASGQPVSDAKVALVNSVPGGGRTVQFARGQLRSQDSRNKLITTDAAGHFEIPSPPEDGTVVAANGAAYGSATVAEVKATGLLMLQALGRIEGVLLQGVALGVGQEVILSSQGSGVYFEFETAKQTTDAQGNFTLENVPAGTFSIARLIKTSSRSWRHSHTTPVVVTAGQTTRIVLGGTDATVQAQVRFETALADTDYRLTAELSTAMPKVPDGLTPEQRRTYLTSDEWKEQMKTRKNYSAVVNPDGSVTLDAVAPGQYMLKVSAMKSDADDFRSQPIAMNEITVIVPPGANPNAPIQIGEVRLNPTK